MSARTETARARARDRLRSVPVPARATLLLAILTLGAAIVNYGSSTVFSRLLGPAGFGDLNALLAVTLLTSVPSAAAQAMVAERIASDEVESGGRRAILLVNRALRYTLWLGVAITAVYCVLSFPLRSTLEMQAPLTALAAAPLVGTSFAVPVCFGVLQGLQRFRALGVTMLAIALARIALGVPWALSSFGGGPGGALLGMALANLGAIAFVLWLVRRRVGRLRVRRTEAGRRLPALAPLAAVGSFAGFAGLSNLDVVLAKAVLEPVDAGLYATLATVGKIAIFLPGVVVLLIVPRAARLLAGTGSASAELRRGASAMLLISLLLVVPAFVAPERLLTVMFGSSYAGAASGLYLAVPAGVGLGLLNLLVAYSVAVRDRRWAIVTLLGVVTQVALILGVAGTVREVALMQACAVGLALLLNELCFHPVVLPRAPLARWLPT